MRRAGLGRWSAGLIALLAGGALLGPAQPVRAQAPGQTQAQPEHYDELVLRALAAYDAGRWGEARRLFEQAHGLNPTARTLRTIGMAAFNQGDYVAALQNLEAALVDSRKPLTEEQRAHVTGLIERANQQVGRYRLQVAPEQAHVAVDGRPPALVAGELVLVPGRHEIVVSAGGHETLARTLDVRPRDRAVLDLQLTPAGQAQAATPAPAAAPPASPATQPQPEPATAPSPATDSDRTTWGIVALSAGAAGLVASGISFAIALDQKSALDDRCPDERCPPPVHDDVDAYDTSRLISGVTLAAGIVGAAIGSYLLLGAGDSEAKVEARVAPGWVSVRGRL